MTETIKRIRKDKNYSIVHNSIFNADMSLESKGLLCYLLTKPDDWKFYQEVIIQELNIGITKYRRLIKELKTLGYLERKLEHKNGKISSSYLIVYEEPVIKKDAKTLQSGNLTIRKPNSQVATDVYKVLTKLNTDNKLSTDIKNTLDKSKGASPEFGNQDINLIFSFWEKTVGYPITSKVRANRNACNNLLKKYSSEQLQQLIRAVAYAHTQKYAPQISDIAGLQSKTNELLRWGKTNISNGGQSETRIID